LKLCGEELDGGPRVHLNPRQVLEISFNADSLEVAFKNPNMFKPIDVKLPDKFKNKDLYFFLEMKQCSTAVKMI
jgi:hypothetical protein